MWEVTWMCFNHGFPAVRELQIVSRSPYLHSEDDPKCRLCHEMMTMSMVEDLRPRPHIRNKWIRRYCGQGQLL